MHAIHALFLLAAFAVIAMAVRDLGMEGCCSACGRKRRHADDCPFRR